MAIASPDTIPCEGQDCKVDTPIKEVVKVVPYYQQLLVAIQSDNELTQWQKAEAINTAIKFIVGYYKLAYAARSMAEKEGTSIEDAYRRGVRSYLTALENAKTFEHLVFTESVYSETIASMLIDLEYDFPHFYSGKIKPQIPQFRK